MLKPPQFNPQVYANMENKLQRIKFHQYHLVFVTFHQFRLIKLICKQSMTRCFKDTTLFTPIGLN